MQGLFNLAFHYNWDETDLASRDECHAARSVSCHLWRHHRTLLRVVSRLIEAQSILHIKSRLFYGVNTPDCN